MMKRILALIMFVGLLQACGTKKASTPLVGEAEKESLEMAYFIIGEGGGFTGLYEQYKVYEDGRVEIWDGKNETTKALGAISTENATSFFKRVKALEHKETQLNKPGNMNYSINYVGSSMAFTLLWSDSNSPNIETLQLYKEIMNSIRLLK